MPESRHQESIHVRIDPAHYAYAKAAEINLSGLFRVALRKDARAKGIELTELEGRVEDLVAEVGTKTGDTDYEYETVQELVDDCRGTVKFREVVVDG